MDTGLCAYLTGWTSPETLSSGSMCGSILETHVLAEIIKSWWHRAQTPELYYYRDRDGREIDFVFAQDQTLYPVEVKLAATPKRDWVKHFEVLSRFPEKTGEGAVVCLCKEPVPLSPTSTALPVSFI